jgi:magnesium chelatase family protein
MVSHIATYAFKGIDVVDVDVQCQLANGMVNFTIVGLGDKAVAESRERIKSAFTSIGLAMPPRKVVVNLSPADLVKEGSHYDLPIILALLVEMRVLPADELANFAALGEIGLDAKILPVNGVLPAAIEAAAQSKGIICPLENGGEACWASDDLEILAPANLLELINHFKGSQVLRRPEIKEINDNFEYPDFKDVKGQENAKRAAEIAATGGHNFLMVGPPGSGKSMIASRIAGILPELDTKEILEISIINSISGNIKNGKISRVRPFRDPHHNCSMPAMIGGGAKARPGEISLAHKGILFLDELPEFPRQVLDSLRQPLEEKRVTISRVQAHTSYPADFQLIAAMNPCVCGYLDDASRACSRAPKCAEDYQLKLSGPMFDRIDIHIEVPAQNPLEAYEKDGDKKFSAEASSEIRKRVLNARNFQQKRNSQYGFKLNSEAGGDGLQAICTMSDDAKAVLVMGVEKLKLSMRGHSKVLKVARTIADLAGADIIEKTHMLEALSYRQRSYQKSKN